MQREAIERARYNQHEAKKLVVDMVANDRRFDSYDAAKLTDEVYRCADSARRLNWDDPALKRGPDQRQNRRRFTP
jgi:hypothetical protein